MFALLQHVAATVLCMALQALLEWYPGDGGVLVVCRGQEQCPWWEGWQNGGRSCSGGTGCCRTVMHSHRGAWSLLQLSCSYGNKTLSLLSSPSIKTVFYIQLCVKGPLSGAALVLLHQQKLLWPFAASEQRLHCPVALGKGFSINNESERARARLDRVCWICRGLGCSSLKLPRFLFTVVQHLNPQ